MTEKFEGEITLDTPCTLCVGTDKYASRICAIPRKNAIIVSRLGREDDERTITRRKDGTYYEKGRHKVCYLKFGEAITYLDPSF